MGSLRSLRKEKAKDTGRSFNEAMVDFLETAANHLSVGRVYEESYGDYLRVFTIEGDRLIAQAFVKETTGEIFKPRSVKAPVKVSYGNIFNRDNGLSGILWENVNR